MPSLEKAPHTVHSNLNFLSPALKEKPYYGSNSPDKVAESNIIVNTVLTELTDVRSLSPEEQAGFTLDTSGFQFYKHQSVEKDFTDEKRIKDVYYPEVEALLKSVTGAKRIYVFDHTIRRRSHDAPGHEHRGDRGPGLRAHVDQSPKAGAARVKLHLGDEADELLKGRVQIINVWRPLRGPVQDTPLAMADFRTVDPVSDVVATDLIYPERTGETYSVRHSPAQKWYWFSEQQTDEVILLKCYENEVVKGRALFTPHSAFINPEAPKDALPRWSIEVRALVFY
ncbi:hypothetical protein BOTBODRAFT_159566 [Botryobasidium botryosum FD-172 SS1]|uniref:Methyltransferase n=1 Tax=Botryobasidium botryosum (strain FD-172 SS1) TaxID=930990 RepID=A0A067MF30_BOTB1|nr:hypothetical protein BOTBODRAFT_159566 [Botryobasidium botryosum FD-172 SS1]